MTEGVMKVARRTVAKAKHTGSAPSQPLSRREEIVVKASEFFATFGFDASTRDFANYLGTTQPLIYRYFSNKEDLIQEVYRLVYLQIWDQHWDDILVDPTLPLRDRLIAFYNKYTDAIMNKKWMRLYLFAGLKGVQINNNYLMLVEERVIRQIIAEFWKDRKLPWPATIDREDMEIVYNMHCGIFYYGVRRFIYQVPTYVPEEQMVTNAIDIFIAGYDAFLKRKISAKTE